ncbi:hypothetical protein V6U90_10715 [Micromonospora sp. CPCC 206060]|uniref:hypothetical protein n=1 Tax=Micromonospora sp. CPCC 206060 TaxID=3122406 RepID=UPI002FF00028
MTDGIPLKLRLKPDDYRCVWLVPGDTGQLRRLDGDVDLIADRPPKGNAYGEVPMEISIFPNGTTFAHFPQTSSHSILRGEMRNGLDLLLLDADIVAWHPDAAAVRARAALTGRWPQNEPLLFDDLKIQVTGLDTLAGVGPLKSFSFPTSGLHGQPWTVEANPDSQQGWSDDGATLSLNYDGSFSVGDAYFYRMAFSPVIYIKLWQTRRQAAGSSAR